MKIILDDWQKKVLEAEGDILVCKGRRIGATFIMAVKAVEYLMKHKGSQLVCVSLTEDQAKLIISFALDYANENYKKYIGKGKEKPQLGRITVNGGHLLARPVGNTGDAVRGFNGNVLMVDEASRMPSVFWMAAKPILLTTGGEIWMWSTPFGKQGYFWERFDEKYNKKDPKARFKVFYHTSEEIVYQRPISASWTKEQQEGAINRLEAEKKDMSRLEYGQEYLGLFMEDLQQFFPDELLDEILKLKRREIIVKGERRYYLGCDIAGLGEDVTTFEILDKINRDNIEQVENIVKEKQLTTQTAKEIISLNESYNFFKIGIDDGGVGFGVWSELITNEKTKRKTFALNNASRPTDKDGEKSKKLLKEEMYINLKSLMENKKIRLLNDDNLRQSLRSIQYEYVKREGKKSYFRIFGNNSHIAEGLIRGAWLCSQDKGLNIFVRTF